MVTGLKQSQRARQLEIDREREGEREWQTKTTRVWESERAGIIKKLVGIPQPQPQPLPEPETEPLGGRLCERVT